MRNFHRIIGVVAATLMLIAATARGQTPVPDEENYQYDYDRVKIDRYLDVEIWTDHSDEEYYQGDKITLYFRANRDCFVAIYSIDTRGRVNLLFPSEPGQENYIYGGLSYRLPGEDDNYDLEVSGPEGFEYLQIIASRERIDIPNWYHNSGLVSDAADMDEYMDYLNLNYFVRYGGQRFAFDRTSIYVNEWEEYYFRPVYWPYYPSWTVYGNCYIDYPWGSSVYINGVYWGCTPLYIPRLVVGWHTITIYDPWHHCWESDFHVSRHNTMVFNRTVITTSPTVKSKYKEVQAAGYRNPVKAGYPEFEAHKASVTKEIVRSSAVSKTTRGASPGSSAVGGGSVDDFTLPKNYVRGSAKVVKTDRGYESDGTSAVISPNKSNTGSSYRRSTQAGRSTESGGVPAFQGRTKSSSGKTAGTVTRNPSAPGKSSDESSGSYRKISGGTTQSKQSSGSKAPAPKGSSGGKIEQKQSPSGGSSSGKIEKKQEASGGSKSGNVQKKEAPKSQGGAKSSTGGNLKSAPKPSQGGNKSGGTAESGSKAGSGSFGKSKR